MCVCETPPFHGTKFQGNIFQAPVNFSDHVVSCSVSFLCNRGSDERTLRQAVGCYEYRCSLAQGSLIADHWHVVVGGGRWEVEFQGPEPDENALELP